MSYQGTPNTTRSLQVAVRTDVGRRRDHNEDNCGRAVAPDGAKLFVVCDGMGGFAAGEEASEAAVQAVVHR